MGDLGVGKLGKLRGLLPPQCPFSAPSPPPSSISTSASPVPLLSTIQTPAPSFTRCQLIKWMQATAFYKPVVTSGVCLPTNKSTSDRAIPSSYTPCARTETKPALTSSSRLSSQGSSARLFQLTGAQYEKAHFSLGFFTRGTELALVLHLRQARCLCKSPGKSVIPTSGLWVFAPETAGRTAVLCNATQRVASNKTKRKKWEVLRKFGKTDRCSARASPCAATTPRVTLDAPSGCPTDPYTKSGNLPERNSEVQC